MSNFCRDRVRLQGVRRMGYGVLPFFVMLDGSLLPESKALYAHFVSYAGNGDSAYPSRSRIMHEMNIGKNAYYKYLNQLISLGYIEVEQQKETNENGGKFLQNVYTLIFCPEHFKEAMLKKGYPLQEIEDNGLDLLGYGFVPKLVMADNRLRIRSKTLYCYYAVFSGAAGTCHPSNENLRHHLNIGYEAYLKSQRELIHFQYIRAELGRNGGQYQSTVVTLIKSDAAGIALSDIKGDVALLTSAKPISTAVSTPHTEKGDTVFLEDIKVSSENKKDPSLGMGDTVFRDGENMPHSEKRDTGMKDTGMGDTNINNININNLNSTKIGDTPTKIHFCEKKSLSTLLERLPFKAQTSWLAVSQIMSHTKFNGAINTVVQCHADLYEEASSDKNPKLMHELENMDYQYLLAIVEALVKSGRGILYPVQYSKTALMNAVINSDTRELLFSPSGSNARNLNFHQN